MTKRFGDIYLIGYLLLVITGLVIYFSGPHGTTVLWINTRHHPVLDFSFQWLTYLGDGITFAIAVAIFLILRWRTGLILLGLGLVQTLLSFLLKRVIFPGTPRPKTYFEDMDLHFVAGVKVHAYNAFPSGHTMTAFALATFLVYAIRNQKSAVLLLLLATLAGFSRIYLLQHFLIDVCVGSFLGVVLGRLASELDRRIVMK